MIYLWQVLGLALAATPFIYYLLAIFSAWRYFRQPWPPISRAFTPSVSNLKPIRGLDPDAYENLASFCRQDYPDYELLLCVDPTDDAVHSVIERLRRDFPERAIRVLYGAGRNAANDKVAKLVRLVNEANHEVVVISDSDVRVKPDYLRSVVSPLSDPRVGAVTCFYVPTEAGTFAERLHTVGMMSDFYAGILTAWQLDGVKFALGKTIVTTRTHLAGFGGYAALENRPGDDLLVGRLIAEGGRRVEFIPYCVETVAHFKSLKDLVDKRTRWLVVMRSMRPAGHFGLLFTQGLIWSLAAIALHPSAAVALAYLGTYLSLRVVLTWMIGIRGLRRRGLWRELPWIPVWDAIAFLIWVASFMRRSIRWRGTDYYIRNGALVPVAPSRAGE